MPATTQEKKPPKTAAERQQKYHKSLLDKGLERITLVVENSAAQCLRDLSRDHNKAFGEVFALGVLVAQRELKAMEARKLEQAE